MRTNRRLVAAAVLATLACASSVKFVPANRDGRPLTPRSPDEVEVFTRGVPAQRHVAVGTFTSQARVRHKEGMAYGGPPELLDTFRRKGAEQGCDAVVVTPGSGDTYEGTCIVYQ